MIDQITNELIIASRLLHTNNVNAIAGEIGYKPMLIINALSHGVEVGKLTYNKKKGIIKISEGVESEHLSVTESMNELIEQLELFARYRNAEGKDDAINDIMAFLPGTPELHIKIAVFVSKKLDNYDLADPKDKQSVYTFVTLKENVKKQFGLKQFDTKIKTKLAKTGKSKK